MRKIIVLLILKICFTESAEAVCPGGNHETCTGSCDFEDSRARRICIRSCAEKCRDKTIFGIVNDPLERDQGVGDYCARQGGMECRMREVCPGFIDQELLFRQMKSDSDERKELLLKLRNLVCNKKEKKVCCAKELPDSPSDKPDLSPSVRLSAVVTTCGIRPAPSFTHAVSGKGKVNAPWAVSIGEYEEEEFQHHCTGSLITPSIVLSAAHCITSVNYHQPSFRIRAGLSNLQNSRGGQERKINKSVFHDKWKEEGKYVLYFDIALLFLENQFDLDEQVQLLCLPMTTQPPTTSLPPSMEGDAIITVGWGRNDKDVIGQEITKIDVSIISQDECISKYNRTSGTRRKGVLRQLPRLIEDTQFCGENFLNHQIGTCHGDSGGPTFVRKWTNNRERFTIVGVTSGSSSCGGKDPDFYTFVAHEEILSWIHKAAAEDEDDISIFNHLNDGRSVVCQANTDCASDDCIEGICTHLFTQATRLGPSQRCNSVGSHRMCHNGTGCVEPLCNRYRNSCWCPARRRSRRGAQEAGVRAETGNSTGFTFVDGAPEDWEIECSSDQECPSEWFCEDELCFAPFTFPTSAWKSLYAPIAGGVSTIQISGTNIPSRRCPNGGRIRCNSNRRCWCTKRWNRRRG